MAHLHYEEEQRFTSVVWIWVFSLILILVPVLIAVLSDTVSEPDKIVIALSTVLGFIPVVAILWFSKLQLRIDDTGLHYRFPPAVFRWKTVSGKTIQSFEVSEKRTLSEKMEIGFRRSLFFNTTTMNISGTKIARIQLHDGQKLKIGSENPEGIERALKKLTSAN